jgi:isochorismate synthase
MDNKIEDSQKIDSWVFYRRPATSEIVHIAGKSRTVKNNMEWLNHEGFVIAPFNKSNSETLFVDTVKSVNIHTEYEIRELFSNDLKMPSARNLTNPRRIISKREYLSLFNQMKKEIESNAVDKVVLSRVMKVDGIKPQRGIEIFIELCRKYPSAFISFFYTPKAGLWIGATPETLMARKGTRCRIASLAGTTTWQTDLTFEQLWNRKEQDEQQMVTDFVKDIIGELEIVDCDMKGPETVKAGSIVHLRTIFRFMLDDISLVERLINRLHPTPAVCGLPKERAIKLIEEIERYERTYYSGFIGPVCADSFNLFVNLRCMQFTNKGVQLYVGGGLTKDSQSESEWEETQLKAETILSVVK